MTHTIQAFVLNYPLTNEEVFLEKFLVIHFRITRKSRRNVSSVLHGQVQMFKRIEVYYQSQFDIISR